MNNFGFLFGESDKSMIPNCYKLIDVYIALHIKFYESMCMFNGIRQHLRWQIKLGFPEFWESTKNIIKSLVGMFMYLSGIHWERLQILGSINKWLIHFLSIISKLSKRAKKRLRLNLMMWSWKLKYTGTN